MLAIIEQLNTLTPTGLVAVLGGMILIGWIVWVLAKWDS